MESRPQKFVFRGLDSFAGFRHGKKYQLTPDHWDDGSGTVTVEMPHAGRAKFDEKQWRESREKSG